MQGKFSTASETNGRCAQKSSSPVLHAHERDDSNGALPTSAHEKLTYFLPKIESAHGDGKLPPDVVAEWSGLPLCNSVSVHADATVVSCLPTRHSAIQSHESTNPSQWICELPEFLRRRSDVREYPIDNEALLFVPHTQMLYSLNETAFAIWRACDGRTMREIALLLSDEYDSEFDVVLGHVTQTLHLLALGGLFEHE
jgi:hypothetical protein